MYDYIFFLKVYTYVPIAIYKQSQTTYSFMSSGFVSYSLTFVELNFDHLLIAGLQYICCTHSGFH